MSKRGIGKMSNLLFANEDRLKTIGRFLAFDRVIGINQRDSTIEQEIVFRGKRYKISAKLTKVREAK